MTLPTQISNQYRYSLASNKLKKLDCPKCRAKKHWQLYLDNHSKTALPEKYGRCDNEIKCGYHLNPYVDGYNKSVNYQIPKKYLPVEVKRKKEVKHTYIPFDVYSKYLDHYDQNTFIQNLLTNVVYPFEQDEVKRLIELYYLGTIIGSFRHGAIAFPFIDKDDNIVAVQEKLFDHTNHTYKSNYATGFLHSRLLNLYNQRTINVPSWLEQYSLYTKSCGVVNCLFGEHLLKKHPNNPVAIVEAPKTALVATLYFGFPDCSDKLLWLSCYNLSSLNHLKCNVLESRDVVLFPDLSQDSKAHNIWSSKAKQIQEKVKGCRVTVSDFLERHSKDHEKQKGLDLADFLIQLDWRDFNKSKEVV